MTGMSFTAFLTLLVFGLVSALGLHVYFRYRVLAGLDGFIGKWIAGWIGGWLGSPVFGHWGGHMQNVYIIPALLGAFVGPFLVTAMLRALDLIAKAARPDVMTATPQPSAAPRVDMRKAS